MDETRGGRPRSTTTFPPEWRVLGVLAVAVVAYLYLRPLITLILLFATGLLLAAALHPTITWMEQRLRLPRGVPALLLVLVMLALLYAVLSWVIPLLLDQVIQLASALPAIYDRISDRTIAFARRNPALADYLQRQAQRIEISGILTNVINQIGVAGQALVAVFFAGILVLVVALYSLLHPVPLVSGLLLLWRQPGERDRVAESVNASLDKIRAWMFGQISAMLIVGLLSALALRLLGVPYAFLFGVLAALLEAVPTVGPILSAVPPMIVASTQHPMLALWVAVAFTGVQALENQVIVPLVYAGALRIHPVAIAFSVLTMGALFGLLGVFLAIPLLAIGQAIYEEFYRPPAEEEHEARQQARDVLQMPPSPRPERPAGGQ